MTDSPALLPTTSPDEVSSEVSPVGALLPAALVLLWSFGAGTFTGSATASWAVAGHLSLLAIVAWGRVSWQDPLLLNRLGNVVLCVLLFVVGVLSWYASEIPRAGKMILFLTLPVLLIPRWVTRLWATEDHRRLGLTALTAVTAAVAFWSLVGVLWLETPGASLPLGHHNLLAAWLVLALPLAWATWQNGGKPDRVLAVAALVLGLAAILASRSLSGLVGFMVAAFLLVKWRRRWLWAVLAGVVGLAVIARDRLGGLFTGNDISVQARLGYMEAAWNGILERPLLGWGPGTASWTLARFLEPRPGVHPADEVVTDPHSLPLTIAYEMGLPALGLILVVAAIFIVLRWREEPVDGLLRRAAFAGLGGFLVTSLAGRSQAAPALFLLMAVVIGAVLAAGPPRPTQRGENHGWAAIGLAVFILPVDLAHLSYDRARTADDPNVRMEALLRAQRRDPNFPLYRFQRGLMESNAEHLYKAARDARGLAHFWLAAGAAGQETGEPWAEEALLNACALNPLGALAPWRLATGTADEDQAVVWAGRALLAEPLLMAADAWQGREELRRRTAQRLEKVEGVEGVDALWRVEILERSEALGETGPHSRTRSLALEMDTDNATSLSLHAFRRRPWPAEIDRARLVSEQIETASLVAATTLDTTNPTLFVKEGCGLGSR